MKTIRLLLLPIFLLILASCSPQSTPTGTVDANAVVATTAADYSSGAYSIISKDKKGVRIAVNNYNPRGSDITVAAYGQYFYMIGRTLAGNNITKYASNNPRTQIWQFSTNSGSNSTVLSNPHDMIFASATKAYVLRYGTSKVWIVNPSATTAAGFKIGELDLSAYNGAGGTPDMDGGVIVKGKLYITLQRLDKNYDATQNGYIAIFNVKTDKEIDAHISGDNLKGIPLQVRNPTGIIYEAKTNSLFVQGSGNYYPPLEYTGGIEEINLDNYAGNVIVDDGDAITHLYGFITKLAVISPDLLYFVGYNSFKDNTLYRFDLKTHKIKSTAVSALLHGQIAYITVDKNGLLWVSDSANATVHIINPLTDTEVDELSTSLNPGKIVFTQ